MATKEKDTNKELEVEEIVSKSEQFIENNSKKIIYGIIAVALVVGAVLGIKHGYLVPQEKKAAAAMFKGEQYFARDSFALALNGNGADYEGFEAIIDQYGSTRVDLPGQAAHLLLGRGASLAQAGDLLLFGCDLLLEGRDHALLFGHARVVLPRGRPGRAEQQQNRNQHA